MNIFPLKKRLSIKTKYLSLILILSTVGCASTPTGPKFSADTIHANKNKGTVVFYRSNQFTGGFNNQWPILANGNRVTGLRSSTYSVVKLPAGQYIFNSQTSRIDTQEHIEVKAGTVQYIYVYQGGFSYGTFIGLTEKTENEALADLHDVYKAI